MILLLHCRDDARYQYSMDRLETEITETLTRISEYERSIEREKARLEGLRFAADARPVAESQPKGRKGKRSPAKSGRQEGAISFPWRDVLWEFGRLEHRPLLDEIVQIARRNQLAGDARSYKQRLQQFAHQGLITIDDGYYQVTAEAVKRFNLKSDKPPSTYVRGGSPIDEETVPEEPPSSQPLDPGTGE